MRSPSRATLAGPLCIVSDPTAACTRARSSMDCCQTGNLGSTVGPADCIPGRPHAIIFFKNAGHYSQRRSVGGLDGEYSRSLVLAASSLLEAFSLTWPVLPHDDTMRRGTGSHTVAGVFSFIPHGPFVVHGGNISDGSPAHPGGTKKERRRVRLQCPNPRDEERRMGSHLLYMAVACVSARIPRVTDDRQSCWGRCGVTG